MRKLKKAVVVMSVGSLCIAPAGMNTLYAQQNQLFHQSNLLKNDAASLLIGNQIAESIEGSVKEIPCENGEYKLTYGDSLKIHTTDSYFYEGENPEGITITNEKKRRKLYNDNNCQSSRSKC